ncbi:trypsin-like peptidase domain-containing protein [Streptomyces diastaticus]|uniref:nSTAND1 domain-containing NTPase n=2 Tax=Streptomyces TaxID=1883 RepID=UPI0033DCDD74
MDHSIDTRMCQGLLERPDIAAAGVAGVGGEVLERASLQAAEDGAGGRGGHRTPHRRDRFPVGLPNLAARSNRHRCPRHFSAFDAPPDSNGITREASCLSRGRGGSWVHCPEAKGSRAMAAEWRSDVLGTSQVRIRSVDGDVAGAGFLVAADLVCTCAHVVEEAFGLPAPEDEAPGGLVNLDFPLLSARRSARASVVSWRHGGADVALLRLDRPVEGARPAGLVDGTAVWEHPFRVFGHPDGADHGVWVRGTLRAGQGAGLLQMEAHLPGPRVTEGFSGSPVWDDAQGGVVGMTVAAHRGESTAYLLPSADLIDEHSMPARCPFQGLEPFTEEQSEFFHGRDADTIRVLEALQQRPVVLVVGPSGCGKSSLVRAGVLPRLRDQGAGVSELRPVPGARATSVLAHVLTDVLEPGLGEIERLTRAEELAWLLTDGEDVLPELRGRILARGPSAGHVLFVDQLEEYARAVPAEACELFRMLSGLAGRRGTAALRVVATARPDSLDALVTVGTSDVVSDAVQFLAPLSDDDLKRAVTAPVDAVPGLWFEPGLPERIVADAGNEPGRMPLVQFALTELWHQRSNSMLTHAAYDAFEGIAGALAKHADGVHAQLSRKQQELAPRLFAQLARPGDGDTFVRRPARTTDLAPELLELVRELTRSSRRLLVLSHAPGESGQEEIVDLAHEALIELWPLLRAWLVESRDFRAWQEQLRADVGRWQARKSDPARLLGGVDLAEADLKLKGHSQDVSAEERTYIQLSHRHSRRRIRVRRGAVGVLAVLTVLSVVLALSTWRGLQRAEQQLRLQAAGLLAQASEARPPNDPATALQLALAAYNARPTATTRQVLLNQYVRGQHLLASHPSVWKGRATNMTSTPDGRVLVVTSKRSSDTPRFTVVTDALSGTPRARELSGVPKGLVHDQALSPDGRFFAASSSSDVVLLWRLDGSSRPESLSVAHTSAGTVNGTLDFSSDSKRLLVTMKPSGSCSPLPKCPPAFAEAWETGSGARIRVPDGLVPKKGVQQAAFTSDPDSVATVGYTPGAEDLRIEIRDLHTSRLRYTATVDDNLISGIRLRAGGELLIRQDGDDSYSQPLGAAPGRRVELPDVDVIGSMDSTQRFHISPDDSSNGTDAGLYDEPILTDLRTGQTHIARIPSARDTSLSSAGLAVVPRDDGEVVVLAPLGTALMIVRAERYDRKQFAATDGDAASSMSPDRRFMAIADQRSLQIVDASGARRQSVPLPFIDDAPSWTLSWTADSRRVVVWSRGGNLLAAYSAGSLKDKVPLDGALPGAKAAEKEEGDQGGEVEEVAALGGSEIALLTLDGRLARVDAANGALLTRPVPAHPDPDRSGMGTLDDIFTEGRLVPRPHHPGQVVAVTRRGAAFGDILLWDLRTPRHIATLSGLAISAPFVSSDDPPNGPLAFDERGSRLAVKSSSREVRVWDVDRRKQLPGSASSSVDGYMVGVGAGGRVLTYSKGQVTIHNLAEASDSATLNVPEGAVASVRGYRLEVSLGGVKEIFTLRRRTFDLRPEAQFRALCDAVGRDYTPAERELLPDGTPNQPPCA